MFDFHPGSRGEMIQFDDSYFSDGVENLSFSGAGSALAFMSVSPQLRSEKI